MAEELQSIKGTKTEIYESLIPQIQCLIQGETDLVANLANIAAALKETFGWLWVGFYLVRNNELLLGPFQVPIACTRVGYGKGVCGNAWKDRKSLLIPDVEKFPGHIDCSSSSVAEIVVPVLNSNSEVIGVIDVDSECFDVLDEIDRAYLEKISQIISINLFT